MVLLWTILIFGFVPNCLLTGANHYYDSITKFDEFVSPSATRHLGNEEHHLDVLKFMKKLYKKVNSGRIPLPEDANTVRSFWPLEDQSYNGYLLYNVSLPKTEELVKATLFTKTHGYSGHPSRILIDSVPSLGTVSPFGVNVPLKDAHRLDIKKDVVNAQKSSSLLTLRPQHLVNGSWKRFQLKNPPIIVTFISDVIPPSLESFVLRDPVTKESFGTKIRRKRESNSIHSAFVFEDLPKNSEQTIDKHILKKAISKRQRYLRKKLNRRKEKKRQKKKKSSKRRKQKKRKKNGFIPYPKDYSNNSKDPGQPKKRKKILPQTFITASLNRISNEVSSSPTEDVPSSGICELKKVFVDFKDLGWDFVIAPLGFSPNFCTGGCPNPLTRNEAGSNHALIRSLMQGIGQWRNVPSASCVADKVTSLTLLIQTEDGRIELKNYPGMEAESCSCQ